MKKNLDEAARLISSQDARKHAFEITLEVDGEEKTGTFKAVYPSIFQRIEIGKRRAALLKGVSMESLDQFTYDLVYEVACLEVLLTEKPDWFDMKNMYEVEPIGKVFGEVMDWINSFRKSDPVSDPANSQPADDASDLEGNEVLSEAD